MLSRLIQLLAAQNFTFSSEAALQAQIQGVLIRNAIPHGREVVLDAKNRIDFLCSNVGVEVKLHGSAKAIYRQLARYAEFPEIASLILVTGRTIGLPVSINGKPCHLVTLGRAWL